MAMMATLVSHQCTLTHEQALSVVTQLPVPFKLGLHCAQVCLHIAALLVHLVWTTVSPAL